MSTQGEHTSDRHTTCSNFWKNKHILPDLNGSNYVPKWTDKLQIPEHKNRLYAPEGSIKVSQLVKTEHKLTTIQRLNVVSPTTMCEMPDPKYILKTVRDD